MHRLISGFPFQSAVYRSEIRFRKTSKRNLSLSAALGTSSVFSPRKRANGLHTTHSSHFQYRKYVMQRGKKQLHLRADRLRALACKVSHGLSQLCARRESRGGRWPFRSKRSEKRRRLSLRNLLVLTEIRTKTLFTSRESRPGESESSSSPRG